MDSSQLSHQQQQTNIVNPLTRLLAVGASCALTGFFTGLIVCYLWFQSQRPSPTHEQPSATQSIDDAEAGRNRFTFVGNDNPRAAKFEALDTDKDGKLTLTEFTGDREPGEAARWFERRDVDHDGSVSRKEYLPVLPLSEAR